MEALIGGWGGVHRTACSHHDSLCSCVSLITFNLYPVLDYPLCHLSTFLPSPVPPALLQHISRSLIICLYVCLHSYDVSSMRVGLCHFILIFSASNRVPEYVFAQLNQILIKIVACKKFLKKSIFFILT